MYGMNVLRAVVAAGESKSGITIHLVNEVYDDGEILDQFEVELDIYDNPEKVAEKVQALEQMYFPVVIEKYLNK
jgi:phosphoribosylglycinamide formyltransferase-1